MIAAVDCRCASAVAVVTSNSLDWRNHRKRHLKKIDSFGEFLIAKTVSGVDGDFFSCVAACSFLFEVLCDAAFLFGSFRPVFLLNILRIYRNACVLDYDGDLSSEQSFRGNGNGA